MTQIFPTPPKIRFEPLPAGELKDRFTEQCQYVQGCANATYSMLGAVPTHTYLVSFADHTHQDYPQHEGRFDHYVLARMTKNITTKLGVAFCHHDIVLLDPEPETSPNFNTGQYFEHYTAFSVRNNAQTGISAEDFELL